MSAKGSKGDIGRRPGYVCFTPKNGHQRLHMRCPFSATTGLAHRSNSGVTQLPVPPLAEVLFAHATLMDKVAVHGVSVGF
jgi:hypothetical protein